MKITIFIPRRGFRLEVNVAGKFEMFKKENKESVKSLHIVFPFQQIHIFHKLSSSIIRQPSLLLIPSPKVHIIYSTNFLILCMMFLLIFLLAIFFIQNDWLDWISPTLNSDESERNTWSFTGWIDCSVAWEEVSIHQNSSFEIEFNFPWKFLSRIALWFSLSTIVTQLCCIEHCWNEPVQQVL